jgi:cyclic pyranopterin phosphate synthase
MLYLAPMTSLIYEFEGLDDRLESVPMSARRSLDLAGRGLSLAGWQSLSQEVRRQIARAGAADRVAIDVTGLVTGLVDRATPPPTVIPPNPDPSPLAPPPELVEALGSSRSLDKERWRGLSALDRYALVRSARAPDTLARAYAEILRPVSLTHLTPTGSAHMVDIKEKQPSARRAIATACVRTTRAVVEAVAAGRVPKGDVLGTARVAGILAAKRTPDLIPLCHPVQTTGAAVEFELDPAQGRIFVTGRVEAIDRTGVEMEALVAVAVASLTLYDMIKSADRWATIDAVRLQEKSGGKSGTVTRSPGGDER